MCAERVSRRGRVGSARLDAANLTEHPRGGLHLAVDGAIHALGADHSLKVGKRLIVTALLEEQFPEREAGLGEQDDVLGGDRCVDGVAESGLRQLGLAPSKEFA